MKVEPVLQPTKSPPFLDALDAALVVDLVALTKPRIILLLVVTAIGTMFLAAQGPPPPEVAVLVVIGGSLAAGGANALNQYLDRDIDERMTRTRRRPLPGRRLHPRTALAFGVALNLAAFAILAGGVNVVSAVLAVSATALYVAVYTLWLKRTTPQNIVIGGAAGAFPPLVAWAGVTGELALPALYLFGIIFFWTPPHFWALALLLKSDYARAGVPMLPVVRGVAETTRQIMLHSALLIALSVLLYTVEGLGVVYLAGASALGALFLYHAWRLLLSGSTRQARHLYLYSLGYMALLFFFIGLDGAMG